MFYKLAGSLWGKSFGVLFGLSRSYAGDDAFLFTNCPMLLHNFTDGMALGSAFLIYGSVGGWSRIEPCDFGILVRSVRLHCNKGTLLQLPLCTCRNLHWQVLVWGNEPGQSIID
ncbi:hypothetical protein YC2023_091643 [Brassica napus]